ncbi:MAG: DUF2007 domain-containing protein [Granulosicoccus sp.]|nr:DUF2007 domain-containing protein [Granulosicoccus sp.]
MPLVYRAANLIEAQLVVDHLRDSGLQARITGTYLSGAIGELPPDDVIGVWLLEERHYQRARDIIDTFEAGRQSSRGNWQCKGCDEWLSHGFDICWQCGEQRPL